MCFYEFYLKAMADCSERSNQITFYVAIFPKHDASVGMFRLAFYHEGYGGKLDRISLLVWPKFDRICRLLIFGKGVGPPRIPGVRRISGNYSAAAQMRCMRPASQFHHEK